MVWLAVVIIKSYAKLENKIRNYFLKSNIFDASCIELYCSRFELKLRTFSTFFSSSKNIPDVINFAKNTK